MRVALRVIARGLLFAAATSSAIAQAPAPDLEAQLEALPGVPQLIDAPQPPQAATRPAGRRGGFGGTKLSGKAQQCVAAAAVHHTVNPFILEAIVRHESRGNPREVVSNSNGTVDVGLMGINSVHFPELAQKGVLPQDLFDECVAIYVGAWKLSKKIAKHGNTWRAIGAYHSETPRHNVRYQNKIWSELQSMGVVQPELNVSSR